MSDSGKTTRQLAIVPAYNEEGSITAVVDSIHRAQPSFDVLVVDDGSTDRTSAAAVNAGAHVLIHPFNLGIGGAMQSGFRYAYDHGYDCAVQIDGDGQHDPKRITDLLVAMNEQQVDLVTGSRFLGEGNYKASPARRLGIKMFALVLSVAGRKRVTDPTSGFRLCNRRAIELFAHDYPHDYPEVEAVLMLKAHMLTMVEVPVEMNQRTAGKSSITVTQSVYYVAKVMFALAMRTLRKRPLPIDAADQLAT